MISSRARGIDWIRKIRADSQIPTDPILIEKMILALVLLEGLHNSGLDFVFKGGTCMLLVLGAPKRFSIDIDIVVNPDEALDTALQSVIQEGIFHRFEEDKRSSDIPKRHYKFFFTSEVERRESSILLDVLFEVDPYPVCQNVPLNTEFIILDGEPSLLKCPVQECLLGDKLTAFAPNSTGVLYGKHKELEIIKQLYDIGLLFDVVTDVDLIRRTFHAIASKEIAYRKLASLSTADVLSDIFETACLIGMHGYDAEDKYAELQSGIKKLAAFIYAERFSLDSAILCAAKTAYLASLIRKGASEISRIDPSIDLTDLFIQDPRYNKLNKVKKTSPEAFYYFYKALEG